MEDRTSTTWFVGLAATGLLVFHTLASFEPAPPKPRNARTAAPETRSPPAPAREGPPATADVVARYEPLPPLLLTPERRPELLLCRAGDSAFRGQPVRRLECAGGPADGQSFPLPGRPEDLALAGAPLVWVSPAGPHSEPGVARPERTGTPAGSARRPHATRVEFKAVGLYALEERDGDFRLAFVGEVEPADLARWMRPQPARPAAPPAPDLPAGRHACVYPTTTPSGAARRMAYFPVPCSGGPADGAEWLLTADPARLFDAGCGAVWVYDLGTPAAPPGPGGSDKKGPAVGSVGLYWLEREADKGYRLRHEGTALAEEFTKSHAPKRGEGEGRTP